MIEKIYDLFKRKNQKVIENFTLVGNEKELDDAAFNFFNAVVNFMNEINEDDGK